MASDETKGHGTKALGVEWAPLNIPLNRRLQTLAVIWYCLVVFWLPFILLGLVVYLIFFTNYWWIVAIYYGWFIYDIRKTAQGSRPSEWFRRSTVWKYFKEYFPVTLTKMQDLDPKNNYIFACHPHGIISMGAFTNFGTEANDFSGKFPGLKARLMTLVANFWAPLRREYFMALGGCEVSKESISYILEQPEKGYAVVIVVGGAEEALDAHPGQHVLVLSKRKGFVKMAMRHGADLVPVFSFGENDLYMQVENPPGSVVRKIQTMFKHFFSFSPPIFYGRGVFNYTFGFLPFRKPLHTVVGKPIHVEQNSDPTNEELSELHQKYIEGLREMFDEYKVKFGLSKNTELVVK